MKKLLVLILVAAAVGGGYYLYDKNNKYALAPGGESGQGAEPAAEKKEDADAPAANTGTPPADAGKQAPEAGSDPSTEISGRYSSGEELEGPDILVVEVAYDGQNFSPQSVSVKAGDIVIFRNNSGKDFWPASGPHPSHDEYPEFDSKAPVAPEGKFQFKFEKAGTWKYHDHLNPSATGTVNVAER